MAEKVGFIGLGKMGKGMVLHLLENGIDVVAYNRTKEVTEAFAREPHTGNITPAFELKELVGKLPAPRVIWLMVPNGKPIDDVLDELTRGGITAGDTIIDGGNTYYKDTVTRAATLTTKGIHFIDSGTSGGLDGARHGACLMLGGAEDVVNNLAWLWNAVSGHSSKRTAESPEALEKENGEGTWAYFGPAGAGHFIKMVHNGIEYGMNESLGEGMEILSKAPYQIDLAKVAATWQHGSIIRGYLEDLLSQALAHDPTLAGFTGKVGGGETGGWTLAAAREFGVDAPVIENSLAARQKSLGHPSVSSKVVSALRKEYGGHEEAK